MELVESNYSMQPNTFYRMIGVGVVLFLSVQPAIAGPGGRIASAAFETFWGRIFLAILTLMLTRNCERTFRQSKVQWRVDLVPRPCAVPYHSAECQVRPEWVFMVAGILWYAATPAAQPRTISVWLQRRAMSRSVCPSLLPVPSASRALRLPLLPQYLHEPVLPAYHRQRPRASSVLSSWLRPSV